MSARHDTGWDRIYHRYRPKSLPWELGKPRSVLTELLDSRRIVKGKALDLCCGVGTNPLYMAKKGLDVTAFDISDKAVEYAKQEASKAGVGINFLVADFLSLPFKSGKFDFAFDFGCFHHVEIKNRTIFIEGICRVLKPKATYLLVCFSYKNGSAWNHFTKEQILELFDDYFEIGRIKHVSSLEGDNVTRYFYEVLMEKIA
jgi:SAM-dependent methyltransferase